MLVLYGMKASYYTAKIRSYLLHQGLPFEERSPADPRFASEILPQTKRWIIPVMQWPDGSVLQDSNDILDRLDGETTPDLSIKPRQTDCRQHCARASNQRKWTRSVRTL